MKRALSANRPFRPGVSSLAHSLPPVAMHRTKQKSPPREMKNRPPGHMTAIPLPVPGMCLALSDIPHSAFGLLHSPRDGFDVALMSHWGGFAVGQVSKSRHGAGCEIQACSTLGARSMEAVPSECRSHVRKRQSRAVSDLSVVRRTSLARGCSRPRPGSRRLETWRGCRTGLRSRLF